MILSVSRRTDIPAFYSKWFFKRIEEGYVLVRNPMNAKQVSKVLLNPEVIDCIVFWTKNPENLMRNLDKLKNYNYYFQFTLTPYDKTIEVNVPDKKTLINTFIKLSEKIGKEKVVWRYDPILLTPKYNKEHHYRCFEFLAEKLHRHTLKCVISFLDMYSKTERNMKPIDVIPFSDEDMMEIAQNFSATAKKYGFILETCSETMDFSKFGINHGKCIDDRLISSIIGREISAAKDPNQREACGCVKSIDIGMYNTCRHNCLYCYANFSKSIAAKNSMQHDPDSPLLCGTLDGSETIKDREMLSYIVPSGKSQPANPQLSIIDPDKL